MSYYAMLFHRLENSLNIFHCVDDILGHALYPACFYCITLKFNQKIQTMRKLYKYVLSHGYSFFGPSDVPTRVSFPS